MDVLFCNLFRFFLRNTRYGHFRYPKPIRKYSVLIGSKYSEKIWFDLVLIKYSIKFTERIALVTWFWQSVGANFTNILRKTFTRAYPKSGNIKSSCHSFFAISGSAHVKAVCETLVKLIPGADTIKYYLKIQDLNLSRMNNCYSQLSLDI